MTFMTFALAAVSVFIGVDFVKTEVRDRKAKEVTNGIVVWKYVVDEHLQMVGKILVKVPARCHVVIRGKNKSGQIKDRDVTVFP